MNNNDKEPPSIVDIEKGDLNGNETRNNNKIRKKTAEEEASYEKKSVLCHLAFVTVGITFIFAVVAVGWYYMGFVFGLPSLLIALIALLFASGGWHWLYIAVVTLPRDIKALYCYIKLLLLVKRLQKRNATIGDVFCEYVAKTPEKACFIFEGKEWSFREVNEYSNRIANIFHAHGYKKGDVVGLILENRPEFVSTWLGLSKLGITVPFINTNLRQASLLHSITVSNCTAVIYDESLLSAINDISESFPSTLSLYQFNEEVNKSVKTNAKDLITLMSTASKNEPSSNVEKPGHHDHLLYIYTSGTTGLPKAAVISHSRYIFMAAGIHFVGGFKSNDIFYTPLPLYHTAGGIMNVGQALLFGSTVVIRKKFSASGFFPDCQKYKCTVAQYIGEMCRYILATPASDTDKNHSVRLIFGNGLRPQIWPQFIERFKIKKVAEFYGATEGNANIVNIDNTVGAIGFVSRILPWIYPISIIKADPATGEPIRGKNGLCQLCEPNEPGVFIGKILPGNPSRAFLGYVDKTASSKKIVHNVFKKGDSAFLSGDLLTADVRGNLFFMDRTGDTFRWKGENVSTSEVEAQVSNSADYKDTVVYGVEIENMEGRAGMAAILDPERQVDLIKLADGLKKTLPTYARPQFLRLLKEVDMTGTYKLKKLDLQKEGYNPKTINDSLYYLTTKGCFELLTEEIYEQILRGAIRF